MMVWSLTQSIVGLGRSAGGGNGNLVQYSCLENPHGQRRLAVYNTWGQKELDVIEWLSIAQHRARHPGLWSQVGFREHSVQFSHSVMSDSLRPHELQHARPPCPSPTPGVHSDSCPSSQRCHPATSSSVIPFSSCPQSLPASESFPVSQLFAWGGESTGVSALASFFPKKSQDWSPSEWTSWISLQSKGLSRVFSNTSVLLGEIVTTSDMQMIPL